ncbi:MAG: ParB/RepB/Spo0J family partition protein [Methylobacteriaceae bacterium]|nr:ParB/RepB/Spo0J family partition protein [Methylobacteriaceae bacterium]MBV9704153.1 ParB/RepB/Spo0J family partition protein [Methylobacteriaceae bacterium]
MAEEQLARSRLGRGLAALIGDTGDEVAAIERSRGQRRVPIGFLRPNPRNPRKNFDDDELEDLANSIRQRGIIQPMLVRTIPRTPDVYEIIAGERRWRAAQRAGLHEVPVILVEAGDKEALEIAIIENVQRADLNPLEEALGYEQLMSEFSYSQNDLARVIGKSRSHVANMLRLLKLPQDVRVLLSAGDITAGHARALLSVTAPEHVARRIVDQGLTVRDVERIAQRDQQHPATEAPKEPKQKDADTQALERSLSDALGLVVAVHHRGEGGEMRIRYKSIEQLEALCKRLNA